MSVSDFDQTAPIAPDGSLARALNDYAVPGLSAGFADRVLSAAAARPAALPQLRRTSAGKRLRGWRLGRGMVIGMVSFGALASAAAATGLLDRFDIPVPSAGKVWASIAGKPRAIAAAPAPVKAAAPGAGMVAGSSASQAGGAVPVEIIGLVDTPEELGEAFRRIDEVRQGRYAAQRERVDQRIDTALERRRVAGRPLPTPEEEARLREKIDAVQQHRQQVADQRIAARREALARKIENGEVLTREDIIRPSRDGAQARELQERLRQFQELSPEDRRDVLRRLPPEQRRALIEQLRARRAVVVVPEAAPEPEPELTVPET